MIEKTPENIIVGIKANTYPEKRNFSGLNIEGVSFKKVKDFYKYPAFLYFKIYRTTQPRWLNLFNDFNLGKYDILHFFNAVSYGSKPWICTFEYFIPRGAQKKELSNSDKTYIQKNWKHMVSDNCKRLIALSKWAYNSQEQYINSLGYDFNLIKDKLIVLYPPQKIYVNSMAEKHTGEKIKFIFVGGVFFHKGGMEILNVFDKMLSYGAPIELDIISSFTTGDFVTRSNEESVQKANRIIEKHSAIRSHNKLENQEVMKMMKTSDVALLPSYDETFGYSVLEAQACGCPVISTNGAALSEINNEECGWLINLKIDNHQRTVPRTDEDKTEATNIIVANLERIIKEILDSPHIIKVKGENSLERIKKSHDVNSFKEKLKEIYISAISKP